MIIEKELELYKEFCNENFPYSIYNKGLKVSYIESIYKSLEAIDIYEGTNEINGSDTSLKFIRDLEYLLINLLYVLPVNNSLIYSSVLRAITEICLRICYASQFKLVGYDKINKLGFRELDESLKKCYSIFFLSNDNYNKIKDRFGSYSKTIHNQGVKPTLNFLEDCIKVKQIDSNKMEQDINVITTFCLRTLPVIFNISDSTLSTAQKLRLAKLMK